MTTLSLKEYLQCNRINQINSKCINRFLHIIEFNDIGNIILSQKVACVFNAYYFLKKSYKQLLYKCPIKANFLFCFAIRLNKNYYIIYELFSDYDFLALTQLCEKSIYYCAYLSKDNNELQQLLKQCNRPYVLKYISDIQVKLQLLFKFIEPYMLLQNLRVE